MSKWYNTWTQNASIPTIDHRLGGTAFSIGSKGYFVGGGNGGGGFNEMWEYDRSTDKWTQKASFPGAGTKQHMNSFAIGSKGYVSHGLNTFHEQRSQSDLIAKVPGPMWKGGREFWEYDPATNAWTRKADLGCARRDVPVAFAVGGRGYFGTGLSRDAPGGNQKDLWAYDPAGNAWEQRADLPGPARWAAFAFVVGNQGYVGGGWDSSYDAQLHYIQMTDFYMYDPGKNLWTRKKDVSSGTGFRAATGCSIGTKGYVFQGTKLQQYDPIQNSWTTKATFPGQDRGMDDGDPMLAISDRAYITQGDRAQHNLWEYDPVADRWTTRSKPPITNVERHSAVAFHTFSTTYVGTGWNGSSYLKDFWSRNLLLYNGWTQIAEFAGGPRCQAVAFAIGTKAYVGTGDSPQGLIKDFWEYDIQTNIWTRKADLPGVARLWATGFAIGNKGYIGTGKDAQGNHLSDFWEYDPATNIWKQKANFMGGPRREAASFAVGGKGYIGTGYTGSGFGKDLFEYDPATDKWRSRASFGTPARFAASGFAVGTKGYVAAGLDPVDRPLGELWQFDLATNTWKQCASFTGMARRDAVAVGTGTTGLFGTGFSSAYLSDFWEYTP